MIPCYVDFSSSSVLVIYSSAHIVQFAVITGLVIYFMHFTDSCCVCHCYKVMSSILGQYLLHSHWNFSIILTNNSVLLPVAPALVLNCGLGY